MDCEAFEAAMVDELYGELDLPTSVALKRHFTGCDRCASLFNGLRVTRRLADVPMVEPPAELEQRILTATDGVTVAVPTQWRVARVISVAGRWAMRPQTAMAAIFLVMIGASGLLLRGKSSRAPANAEVTVTERGTPAPVVAPTVASGSPSPAVGIGVGSQSPPQDTERARPGKTLASPSFGSSSKAGAAARADGPLTGNAAKSVTERAAETGSAPGGGANRGVVPVPAGSSATAGIGAEPAVSAPSLAAIGSSSPEVSFESAMASYRARRYDEAARAFGAHASLDANAALWEARAIREGRGCRAATTRFDEVAERAAGSRQGWDATFEGALCYRALGDPATARARLGSLLTVDGFRDRARAEMARTPKAQAKP